MIRTHLIQRLEKPLESESKLFNDLRDSLAFGGGLVNGGLNNDAMKLLRPVFRFDYMGSAEFEFGAVPQTLASIFEYSKRRLLKKPEAVVGNVKLKKPVYYICRKEDEKEVIERIEILGIKGDLGDKGGNKISLKESCNLKESLNREDWSQAVGWIELDNDFMFFIDEEMFNKTLKLFGLKNA
jgi:hypothetical protein